MGVGISLLKDKRGLSIRSDGGSRIGRQAGATGTNLYQIRIPREHMTPNTRHSVRISGSANSVFEFTTGSKKAPELTKAPIISNLKVIGEIREGFPQQTYRYTATIKGHSEWGLLYLVPGGQNHSYNKKMTEAFGIEPGYKAFNETEYTLKLLGARESQKCFIAIEQNAAGKWGPEAKKCVKVEETKAKSNEPPVATACQLSSQEAPGSWLLLFAGFLVALLFRRKKSAVV